MSNNLNLEKLFSFNGVMYRSITEGESEALEIAISWITANMQPDEVFDSRTLIAWAKNEGMDFISR
jgi:hypothetical protein